MFDKPNTTPFPDDLIDKDLRNLSGSETKVLMLIVRKTLGFRKYWDYISTSQIEEYAGLSNHAVIYSINSLEKKEFIVSQYICCKCGVITSYSPSQRGQNTFQCDKCKTKESPNKWYALNIKGEDIKKHLEDVLEIAMQRVSPEKGYVKSSQPQAGGYVKITQPLIDKDEKGYVKITQQVMKKLHTQETIYNKQLGEEENSSINSTDPSNGKVENTKENERENYYDIEKKKLTEDDMRESQADRDYEEKFQRVKQLFITNCTAFALGGKPRVFAFRKILEYPEEKIKRVVERAGEYGKNSSEILAWVRIGLEDYDKKYGNNGNKATNQYPAFSKEPDIAQSPEEIEKIRLAEEERKRKHLERMESDPAYRKRNTPANQGVK